jgi:hypothetical protein
MVAGVDLFGLVFLSQDLARCFKPTLFLSGVVPSTHRQCLVHILEGDTGVFTDDFFGFF